MPLFFTMLKRELQIAWREPGEWLWPLLFFVLVITLFPLAISSKSSVLAPLAPGILWVSALLAQFLTLPRLFRGDFDAGLIEQWLLAKAALWPLLLGKLLAFWLIYTGPLLLLLPVLSVMLALPSELLPTLWLTLVLGTPTLLLLGAIPTALTLAARESGALLALLVLPLFLPVLIFAANAVNQAAADVPILGLWYILLAFLVFAFTMSGLALTAALRLAVR